MSVRKRENMLPIARHTHTDFVVSYIVCLFVCSFVVVVVFIIIIIIELECPYFCELYRWFDIASNFIPMFSMQIMYPSNYSLVTVLIWRRDEMRFIKKSINLVQCSHPKRSSAVQIYSYPLFLFCFVFWCIGFYTSGFTTAVLSSGELHWTWM